MFLICPLWAEGWDRLNVSLSGRPVTQDPGQVADAYSSTIMLNNLFETLVRYDNDRGLTIEPCLAESWNVQQAGREWIFNIRKGVRFHDGSELTADDIVRAFSNSNEFMGKVYKTGPWEVKCEFADKRAGFVKTVSQCSFAISKLLPDGSRVGTGPFRLEQWNPDDKIILRAFDQYWGAPAQVEEVYFHCSVGIDDAVALLENGQIDIVDIIPPPLVRDLHDKENIVLSTLEGVNISFVQINVYQPPLDDPELRLALNMLLNVDNIIEVVFSGQASPCRGLLPPIVGGVKEGPPRIRYDPVEARKIINRYPELKDKTLRLVGLPSPRPYCPEPNSMARLIAGYLKGAGLKIEYIRTSSMTDYLDRMKNGEYDLIISGWVLDSRNPDDFYSILFGIGGIPTPNTHNLKDELFESLVLQARTTVSLKKQWEFHHKASDRFFEQVPWMMIAHTNHISATRNGIAGLRVSPTGELRLVGVSKNVDAKVGVRDNEGKVKNLKSMHGITESHGGI
ncbi:MAG: hypothetical protein JXB45_07315 [Candidatus Krumholzibacteriota bacterium]|nr:hypothetical protein [Candidatus Krumholzibacteriota bacterium]